VAKKHQPPKSLASAAINVDTSHRTKNRWICISLIFSWALILRAPIAHIPLDRDEGEYAYIAQRALVGEIPYKTSFDQKPPGTFLIYALIERFIGTSPAAIHWGTQIYTLGTLALVFFIGEKLFSGFAGTLAAFLLALLLADTTVTGNSSNTEIFMILPLTGALYATLLAEESASVVWAFVAGLLLGISSLFKQVAFMNGGFIFLYLAIKSRRRIPLMLSVAAGTGFVFSVIAVAFVMVGAWKEFYDSVIGFNLTYTSLVPLASYPKQFWGTFYPQLKTFWPVYMLVILGIGSSFGGLFSFRILSGWLLFSIVGVVVGGYFREHYFIQILPAVALLATGQLVIWSKKWRPRHFRLISSTVIGAIVAVAIWRGFWYYGPSNSEEKAKKIYGMNPIVESLAVGHYIAEHSKSSDQVFIFGSEPQILYYAARASVNKYFYVYPLMGGYGYLQRQQQVSLDLLNNLPEFIVAVFIPTSFGVSNATSPIFSQLFSVLQESYELIAIVPDQSRGQAELIQGELAKEEWKKNPYWYNGRSHYAFGVWQRIVGNHAQSTKPVSFKKQQDQTLLYNELGIKYMKQGQFVQAVNQFRNSLNINPNDVNIHEDLGLAFYHLKQYEEALQKFAEIIKINPDFAPAYANIGLVYEQLNNMDAAIKTYKEAIRLNPTLIEPVNNLANIYVIKGRTREAIELYQAALRIDPHNPSILQNYQRAIHEQ